MFGVFLTQKGVTGKTAGQVFDNHPLRGEVGIGDQIEAAFFAHPKAAPPVVQHNRSATGRFAGGVPIVVQQMSFAHGGSL